MIRLKVCKREERRNMNKRECVEKTEREREREREREIERRNIERFVEVSTPKIGLSKSRHRLTLVIKYSNSTISPYKLAQLAYLLSI